MDAYKVYVMVDESGYITAVNSSAFLQETAGWNQIDEGYTDRYHHAQGNYFPQPIVTGGGAYRYKLVDGEAVECTPEEIAEQEEALSQETDPEEADDTASVWEAMDNAYREGVDSI